MPRSALYFRPAIGAALMLALAVGLVGCSAAGNVWQYIGNPFPTTTTDSTSGPTSTGSSSGSSLGGSDRTAVDPCTLAQSRKFVTISMRNVSDDYIHYFFIAVAFVDVDDTLVADGTLNTPFFDQTAFLDGAVCPDDVDLYRSAGYDIEIGENEFAAFGDYCIGGPALIYFHRSGQFRTSSGAGTTGLGSAIGPAQGSSPTYDNYFTSGGRQLPVPDIVLFHNPGTGEGSALKISQQETAPCDVITVAGSPVCSRDAFYYVDESDLMAGSTALGLGSGRRGPSEIQGTGCQCTGLTRAYQVLAPARLSGANANCNEFLRGGRIDYVFRRDDQTPTVPQLVWRVTDAAGSIAHDFHSSYTP